MYLNPIRETITAYSTYCGLDASFDNALGSSSLARRASLSDPVSFNKVRLSIGFHELNLKRIKESLPIDLASRILIPRGQ